MYNFIIFSLHMEVEEKQVNGKPRLDFKYKVQVILLKKN
jgi:hypothetical protein